MLVRAWRFATLVVAALALTLTSAHVLELPQKLTYDAELYAAVNTTLYRYFAIVGGVYTVGSIALAFALAFLVRRRGRSFGWTLAGAVALALAFASWLLLVAPVNGEIAQILHSTPEAVPGAWMRLRDRWELGHAVGFLITLAAFGCLVLSVLVETPDS